MLKNYCVNKLFNVCFPKIKSTYEYNIYNIISIRPYLFDFYIPIEKIMSETEITNEYLLTDNLYKYYKSFKIILINLEEYAVYFVIEDNINSLSINNINQQHIINAIINNTMNNDEIFKLIVNYIQNYMKDFEMFFDEVSAIHYCNDALYQISKNF